VCFIKSHRIAQQVRRCTVALAGRACYKNAILHGYSWQEHFYTLFSPPLPLLMKELGCAESMFLWEILIKRRAAAVKRDLSPALNSFAITMKISICGPTVGYYASA